MRLRRRREKPKAAAAPRSGSGPGTSCENEVVKEASLRGDAAVNRWSTAIDFVLLAYVLTGEVLTSAKNALPPSMPVILEVSNGLPVVAKPLRDTSVCLKVYGVPTIATLYFRVPLIEPVVSGLKSVVTVHTPSNSSTKILLIAPGVEPVSEKFVKFLSPTSPPQVERLLKKHSNPAALDSPALINAAAERRRAALVRERLIPGFSLKLTKGEFMVG